MLNNNTTVFAVVSNTFKPVIDSGKKLDFCPIFSKGFFIKNQVSFCFFNHFIHVGQIAIHVIFFCHTIGFFPKLLYIISYRLDISLGLHIIGGKCFIKIIADRKNRKLLFMFSFEFH